MKYVLLLCLILVAALGFGQVPGEWQMQNPKLSEEQIYQLSFVNSNVGYALTTAFAIYKTTDGGDSWFSETGINGRELCSHTNYGKLVWADSTNAWAMGFYSNLDSPIYRSENQGSTWIEKEVSQDFGMFSTDIQFLNRNSGFILAKTSNPDSTIALIHTSDKGLHWSRRLINWVGDNYWVNFSYRISFLNESYGWVAGPNGLLLKTLNGGNTWSRLSAANDTTDNFDIQVLSDSVAWVINDSGLVKTLNGGHTWQKVISASPQDNSDSRGTHQLYFKDIRNGWALLGDSYTSTLYHTTDAGVTWDTLPFPDYSYYYDKQLQCFSILNDSVWLLAGRSGSLVRTTNGGRTFHNFSGVGRQYMSYVNFTSPTNGWAFGSQSEFDNTNKDAIFRTADGGKHWNVREIPTQLNQYTYGFNKFQAFSDSLAYLSGYRYDSLHTEFTQFIFKTHNGGLSFDTLPLPSQLPFGANQFLNPLHGFVSTVYTGFGDSTESSLYQTRDGGVSWLKLLRFPHQLFSCRFINDRVGLAIMDSGFVSKTIDGGATWNYLNLPRTKLISINFIDTTSVYLLSKDSIYSNSYDLGVWNSTNGGNSWTKISNIRMGEDLVLYSLAFQNRNRGWMIGNRGQVYGTFDGGVTWAKERTGIYDDYSEYPFINLTSIQAKPDGNVWAVGENGTIIHYGGDVITGIDNQPQQLQSNSPHLTISPNPVHSTLTVTSPNTGQVDLLTLQGQRLSSTYIQKGVATQISMKNLVPGMYILRRGEMNTRVVKE